MKFGGLYIKYPLVSIGSLAPGHLYYKSKRIAFVQEPKLPFWFVCGARVHENASFDQVAVYIRHHASDVALGVWSSILPGLVLAGGDILPDFLIVLEKITMINGIDLPPVRAFDIRMTKGKLTD